VPVSYLIHKNDKAAIRGKPILFYLVDWLPPDFGAVGQYATIFSRDLAKAGRDVRLIGLTSGVPTVQNEAFETGGTLEVKYILSRPYDKSRLLKRLVWTVYTNVRLIWQVVRDPRSKGADVLFTGAPPFMLYFAVMAKWIRGLTLTYRITDFYPEVIIAESKRTSAVLEMLGRLTWFVRRRVDAFEVLGEDQRRILLEGGIAPQRITLKRDICPVRISGDEPPSPRPAETAGRAVLLYSGNLGVAHEVETVVEGLIRHHRAGSGRFALWLNASGSKVDYVEEHLRSAGVPVARSAPVPLEQLPMLLAAADVHLITLRPRFSGIVLPSKIYACIASRRPIAFIGPRSSDVHLLCTQVGRLTYEQIEPGDSFAFAGALERFAERAYPLQRTLN
jgi:hypothetical protein